ncbi:Uncharacterised protein g4172 [Pycnogonum litorale]
MDNMSYSPSLSEQLNPDKKNKSSQSLPLEQCHGRRTSIPTSIHSLNIHPDITVCASSPSSGNCSPNESIEFIVNAVDPPVERNPRSSQTSENLNSVDQNYPIHDRLLPNMREAPVGRSGSIDNNRVMSSLSVAASVDICKSASSISEISLKEPRCGGHHESINDSKEVSTVNLNETDEENERLLETLREVVRKCTNSDPSKRPTASELITLMNTCLEEYQHHKETVC